MTEFKPNGIAGLEGKEPIGAVLTVGKKDNRGIPGERDRFYIVMPRMNNDEVRPLHPDFAPFNRVKISTIRGNIQHATKPECFEYHLKNQVVKGQPTPPNQRPFCLGDGCKAIRWNGNDFVQINCPNDRCEYRQGAQKLCKPFARLIFRPRWDGPFQHLPAPPIKVTTQSWNSVKAFVGFFDQFEKLAQSIGVHEFSLMGLPFILTLTEKVNKQQKQRFPVLDLLPDGDPVAFLLQQRHKFAQLQGARPVAALTDESEQSPEVIHTDYQTITPGPYKPTASVSAPAPHETDERIEALRLDIIGHSRTLANENQTDDRAELAKLCSFTKNGKTTSFAEWIDHPEKAPDEAAFTRFVLEVALRIAATEHIEFPHTVDEIAVLKREVVTA